MIYNDMQGQDHKVAAVQESTAQNSAKQGNDLFNFISQDNFKKACEVLSSLMAGPGGLRLSPRYFENYFEMANKFIHGARMGDDKRNMVLNAMSLLMSALVPVTEHDETVQSLSDFSNFQ